jgi:hypothetical protein
MEPPGQLRWKGRLNDASIRTAGPLRNSVIRLAGDAVSLGYYPVAERQNRV